MRARDLIFHMHCFCCTLCQVPLCTGDTAAVQGGKLYCGEHVDHRNAHLEEQRPPQQQLHHNQMNEEMSPHSFYCASPQKGRPRKRKCSPHTPNSIGLTLTHPSLLLLDQSNVTESLERNSRGIAEMDPGTELRLGEILHVLWFQSTRVGKLEDTPLGSKDGTRRLNDSSLVYEI